MEGLRDRINEVRDHYRLTNRGFADAIGAKPAATNNYLNGTKEPSMEFIDRILTTYVDISADWLLCGRGSMFYDADKQTDEKLLKELAETKVKLLVQEGVVKELKQIISEKIAEREKALSADTIKGSLLCEDSPCYITSFLREHRKQIVHPYLMYVRI